MYCKSLLKEEAYGLHVVVIKTYATVRVIVIPNNSPKHYSTQFNYSLLSFINTYWYYIKIAREINTIIRT